MGDDQVRYLGELAKLELRPDDRLVLTSPRALTREHRSHLAEELARFFGDDVKVLVLDNGLQLGAIALPPV